MRLGLGLELPRPQRRLLLEMELVGAQFESVLVRTEGLLRGCEYRKAIGLVSGSYERYADAGHEYRSIIDFLIALASPGWDEVIQDYGRGRGRPLIRYVDLGTIHAMDLAVVHLLEELRALRDAYEGAGWVEGASAPEYDELTETGIRLFITPRFPAAVPDPEWPPPTAADENNPMLAR
jgi:hypothetical protein